MKTRTFRFFGWMLLVAFLYGSAYAVARWRKCIVMREYVVKEQRLLVRATGPGWDVRDNWRGSLKNKLNGPVFLLFRPLTLIEDALCGYERPLDPSVLDWPDTPCTSIDVIAKRVREGVKREFKPGWFRGFGFGTILHLSSAPSDFTQVCKHIDRRNKTNGVWQWAVVVFENEKLALGIHTWLHGYLRPVYESLLSQLASQQYRCQSVDAEIDPLIDALTKIGKVLHTIG